MPSVREDAHRVIGFLLDSGGISDKGKAGAAIALALLDVADALRQVAAEIREAGL